ncbi:SDR family NAD(P)-dependent oxidoreductase [Nocardioides sp. GCM10030258]|uniref:SDR family NAD(P)-dependent oxidoreductase n=1 Tax=unclassified Nocardioides TaxID=2615069 RepID=UPI0036156915
MAGRLDGKVALITGTGGGQGRCAALRFAAEGAMVVGCDLKVEGAAETVELVRAAGGSMTSTAPLDLGDPVAVSSWVDEAGAKYGKIDILYNNASAPQFGSITGMTDEQWRSNIRNELDLVFYACRAAWPHLAAAETSVIINIASTHGINALRASPGGFAHAATKHAVIGMTRELANDGGPNGIRVNSISPGFILTGVTEFLKEIPGGIEGHLDHQIIKRTGREEDVVAAALFLASDDASFITGQNIVVDGGYTIV